MAEGGCQEIVIRIDSLPEELVIRLARTAFIVIAAALILASCAGSPEPGALIGPEEAFEMVRKGEAILVDVRDEASYIEAHLAGAILVPVLQVASQAEQLGARERTLITYCSCPNEETSIAAANELISRGVTDVLVLEGGMREWALAGLPFRSGARP